MQIESNKKTVEKNKKVKPNKWFGLYLILLLVTTKILGRKKTKIIYLVNWIRLDSFVCYYQNIIKKNESKIIKSKIKKLCHGT